ncbi:MAG: hypothetical protein MJ152_01560 [Clostridia bacterium]|nr:hypothetical protein [Clostridia bacterium]
MIELNEKFEARADELLNEYADFISKLENKEVDVNNLVDEKNKLREALKLVEDPSTVELRLRVSYRIGRLAKNEGITKYQAGRALSDVVENGIVLPDDITMFNIKVTPFLNKGTKLRYCEDYSLYDVNRIMLAESFVEGRPEVVTDLRNLLVKTNKKVMIQKIVNKAYVEKPNDTFTTKSNVEESQLIQFVHENFVVSTAEKDGAEVPVYVITK